MRRFHRGIVGVTRSVPCALKRNAGSRAWFLILAVRMAAAAFDFANQDSHAIRDVVDRACAKDAAAVAALIEALRPVVRSRVARALARYRRRAFAHDIDDLSQETFAALFVDDCRALRAWDPGRGLVFLRFVGFLAERVAGMMLRARKRDPRAEVPTEADAIARLYDTPGTVAHLEARDELRHLLVQARRRLSATGWNYLQWLILENCPVGVIAQHTGASPDAIYTWRTRIKRVLVEIRRDLI